jgi:two-component system, cell cycle sensor histidine kinase and response regulator CckA
MSDRKWSTWLYPKPTGDPGRDRNARTLQFACLLLAAGIVAEAVTNHQTQATSLLLFAAAGPVAAAAINRAGRPTWAARTAFVAVLLTAVLLVFEARDGFRSLAMQIFPGLLVITVMLLDRASYVTTAGIILVAVTALGIAEKHGLTRAIPRSRTLTDYDSIAFVDLYLLVIALIGSRIARDTQSNVADLHTSVDRVSATNRELRESAEALRISEAKYRRLHESITDAVLTLDMAGQILECNPAFEAMLDYSAEELRRMTLQAITPERWHAFEAGILTEQVLPNGQSAVYEKEYRRRDGSVVPVELRTYLLRNEDGQPTGTWAIVRDITERRRDEQVISEGEQRLRLAKDAAKLGIYEYDIATGAILWDARVREFWGVGPDEPVTIDTFFSGLHPEDRPRIQTRLAHAVDPEGNGEYYGEYRVIGRADGTERWIAAAGQVFFENGRAVRMIGTGQNISERKRAEAELRESEERFRNMADTAPVMIWVTGPDKHCTFVNRTWLEFTGRTLDEELGMGWAACVHPDDRERNFEAFSAAFDTRQRFQVESRWRRGDGEYRLVLCTGIPRFAPGGNFAGYIGSKIDITDLQSERRFRQMAENIDEVFWMFEIGTQRVLYVSPAFEKVWGASPAAVYENRNWLSERVHPDDRDRWMAYLSKQQTEPTEETYRIVRPDGSLRWIHDRAFLVYDPEGRPYRVAGIAEDVTTHRELEEKLRQAYKMEAIGRLAGGIAHDFNNLLTVVIGYLQLVLDATPPSDARHDRLKHIQTASNRASALTSQLLAFSRKQMVQPKSVDVNHLLTNIAALLRPVMGEHIHLATDLGRDLPCVKADPNQLEQVLINLAANARDAMPQGGEFRIRTALGDGRAQAGSGRELGRCIRIQVSDTGCGMSQNVLEHVFEPFFTTKGVGKGTGLGLSTVYGIIQQNQGTIHVRSSPDHGTTFEILLPATLECEDAKAAASPLENRRGTETILVAEDEPGVRNLVCETLEQLGYEVLQAADGREALRVLEQHRTVDVLLTDVIMPVMGGPELAKHVRSLAPGTKVIYMSGYTNDTLAVYGPPQADTEYIQKPFTPAALAEKLRQVLSSRGRSDESKVEARRASAAPATRRTD